MSLYIVNTHKKVFKDDGARMIDLDPTNLKLCFFDNGGHQLGGVVQTFNSTADATRVRDDLISNLDAGVFDIADSLANAAAPQHQQALTAAMGQFPKGVSTADVEPLAKMRGFSITKLLELFAALRTSPLDWGRIIAAIVALMTPDTP